MSETSDRISKLRADVTRYSYQYYVLNCSPITDAEFDKLYNELADLEREFPQYADPASPTQRVGAKCTSFNKVPHTDEKMLSLENTFTAEEVLKYLGPTEVTMEPKIDGLSLKLIYVKGVLTQAITRGDGMEGDDVTANARTIPTIPLKLSAPVDCKVKGEVYMRYSTFNQLNTKLEKEGKPLLANPRNAAAGTLKLRDPRQVAERNLCFVAYGMTRGDAVAPSQSGLTDYLEFLGFQSVYWLPVTQSCNTVADCFKVETAEQLAKRIAEADAARQFLDLPTDGLVFKINDLREQLKLGVGTKYPKWACAYKFPPERKTTRLESITVQVGRTGKLTPVANLHPVGLSGTTVARASICNQDEIDRLGINVGDDVLVEKSAEIIPKIVGLTNKNAKGVYKLPSTCPCCQSVLQRPEGFVDTFCLNPECKDQIVGRIQHACSKQALDIDGCGDVLVQTLVENGVRSISDVFTIDPTFLKAAAKKRFLAGRAAVAGKPFWRKLHALGIDGLGQALSMEIADRWASLPEMFATDDDTKALVEIVGPVVMQNLTEYVLNNVEEIDSLDQLIKLSGEKRASGPLEGKSFCVTGGLLCGGRDDLPDIIRNAGGVWKSSVTSKTDYLVVGTDPGVNKLAAALKYGVPKLTETQFAQMMGRTISTESKPAEDREY
jgi:DNA ligase (NAD+)